MNKKAISRILFLFSLMLFIFYERNLKTVTGVNNILDMMLYYDLEIIKEFYLQIGIQGRNMYKILHRLDYIFIFCFGCMQYFLIKDKLQKIKSNIKDWIFYIPVFARGIFDVLENIFLDIIINSNLSYVKTLSQTAYLMTFLKWVSLALLISELIYLIKKSKNIHILKKLSRAEAVN